MGSSKNRVVILDTSAIITVFEKKKDLIKQILEEEGKVDIYVPESVRREIEILSSKSKGFKKMEAKAALKYIKIKNIKHIESENLDDPDKDLVELAKKYNAIVVTVDKELIKLLRKESIDVITWKWKKFRRV